MNLELRLKDPAWASSAIENIREFAGAIQGDMAKAAREGVFPRHAFNELGRRGLLGMLTPREYGGLGFGVPEYCLVEEELGRYGLVSGQTQAQGERWLNDWGTPEQKSKYLPGLANGSILFSESISEPSAASSLKNLQTTARREGGGWLISGEKCHINMGVESDLTLVYAMAPEGLTAFLVDTDQPGVRREHTHPIGLRYSPTANMYFDDVRVGDGAILGEVGKGLATFVSTFNVSRLGNASALIGIARRALAEASRYAVTRPVGSAVVADFQGNQWTIAECYAEIHAAVLARDHAANLAQQGHDHAMQTSVAKHLAIKAAERVVSDVYALIGGYGLYEEQNFGQYMLDVKLLRVAGGSSEILKNHVAKCILKDAQLMGLA
ncbi:acyl-CoA dehydrogenase [Cupriavidus necator]|uniref:Acyl-CoA dehydrogenase n=1 Tax=Cupriavidus necator TaxID=106590 RepID=A0A1U9UXX2_CUPNE|nr:acyl-CoA dehydrogenase family protein [Cupriavidus necator]AQV97257.1 acyl-CoA dehydrogenase [Cupriavidus necator]